MKLPYSNELFEGLVNKLGFNAESLENPKIIAYKISAIAFSLKYRNIIDLALL